MHLNFLYLAIMIWVVDSHEITVLVGMETVVRVQEWNEHKKIIRLPRMMEREEAIWTIRNLLRGAYIDESAYIEERLCLFDKQWPIKRYALKGLPYIKHGIVHCCIKGKLMSLTEKKNIKAELFKQAVLQHIGQWEERLGILLPDITFRSNKHKPYWANRKTGRICFDKGLCDQSTEMLAYCTFLAVADYSGISNDIRKQLVGNYFPNKKTLDKIIRYAYTSKNSA